MDAKDAAEREAQCYECGLVVPPALVQCPRCGEVKPFPVVSAVQSRLEPYPYVHVNPDGTFRELSDAERDYLETPFHPFDGARPYVKSAYSDRDGWGSIEGPCLRSALPENPQQGSAPGATPATPAMTSVRSRSEAFGATPPLRPLRKWESEERCDSRRLSDTRRQPALFRRQPAITTIKRRFRKGAPFRR